MKNTSIFGILIIFFLIGCDKEMDSLDSRYIAKIVGFDMNCETCIVTFPDDSQIIKREIGESPQNYYHAINLNRDDFKPGQKLLVKVKKAGSEDIGACIALYSSSNLENLYVLEYEEFNDVLKDTIELTYKDCFYNPEKDFSICFDSVLTDSRCPTGVVCVWAGEAIARFSVEDDSENPYFVDLRTGTYDTIVGDYNISYVDLLPYPVHGQQTKPKDYIARLVIKK